MTYERKDLVMTSRELTRVATFPDGSQMMINEWTDDQGVEHANVARRHDQWAVWGPPVNLEVAP